MRLQLSGFFERTLTHVAIIPLDAVVVRVGAVLAQNPKSFEFLLAYVAMMPPDVDAVHVGAVPLQIFELLLAQVAPMLPDIDVVRVGEVQPQIFGSFEFLLAHAARMMLAVCVRGTQIEGLFRLYEFHLVYVVSKKCETRSRTCHGTICQTFKLLLAFEYVKRTDERFFALRLNPVPHSEQTWHSNLPSLHLCASAEFLVLQFLNQHSAPRVGRAAGCMVLLCIFACLVPLHPTDNLQNKTQATTK